MGACALALGAASLQRTGRTARTAAAAKVLSKDGSGRFRFIAPPKPLIIAEQPGATKPLGFWDPLGFTSAPVMTFKNDPTGFKHLREAEIKHGRVAMMGSFGSVFAHYVTFPGFEKVPTGMAALNTDLGGKGFAVLFLTVGLIEASNWKEKSDEPGSYGDPFKLNQYTPTMRNKELNNGRMAMFAMLGQLVSESLTGLDPVQQFGL